MNGIVRTLARPVQSLLMRRGYRIQEVDSPNFLEPLLYRCLHNTSEFFFVEIGANDGVTFDPVYPFVVRNPDKVRGIVVEPMKDVFEELKRNYAGYPRIVPVNAAIHNSAKEIELYRVDPVKQPQLPEWTKGIASFRRDHHTLSGMSSEHMIADKVPCMTFDELLERHDVARVDLLQIDTEGYDYDILMALDFARLRPTIIHFEHGLPNGIMTRDKLKEVVDRLYAQNYLFILEQYDAIAYQPGLWEK
jgi:FkbM family methyltransferase